MNEKFYGGRRKRYIAVKRDILADFPSIPLGVQDLSEFLKLNPDVGAQSKDDAKCKVLLGELGMLELFRRSEEPNLSILACLTHNTHWIVGMLWSGYPKPDDNGYRVFCLPKTRVPEHGVKSFMQSLNDQYGGHDYEEGVIKLPPDWRNEN